MKNKKLIYFTENFPVGTSVMWKLNELKYLKDHFEKITIVPYTFGKYTNRCLDLPSSVTVTEPLFKESFTSDSAPTQVVKLIFSKHCIYFLKEFFRKNIFFNTKWFTPWLTYSLETKKILENVDIKRILKGSDKDTVFYFYWGKGASSIVPFINRSRVDKIIVRMHRYDLYEFENNGYIPYRIPLLTSATLIAPSSQNGYDHIKNIYPHIHYNMSVVRTGVIGEGTANKSEDKTLRILSCSHLIPVKRVDIILRALKLVKIPIEWTHLGDGTLMNDLKREAASLPHYILVNFEGLIEAKKVMHYYLTHPVDLLINVSSSEGVPFSIMEAFSASIPVFATNVGGTGEIVDDTTGAILPADITPEILANKITEFYNLSEIKKDELRKNAYARYSTMCNAAILAKQLAKYMAGTSDSPM